MNNFQDTSLVASDRVTQLSGFRLHRNDSSLTQAIHNVLERYYIDGDRSEYVLDVDLNNRRKDIDVINIDTRFANPEIEDQDFTIFRMFKNPQDLILDIGANWGYSVIDIWATGATCKVISFEPVKFYAALLNRIAELRPGYYDHKSVALSDHQSNLTFVVPVINKLPIYALSSATDMPNMSVMVKNVFNHIVKYMPEEEMISVQLHEFDSPVDTLDNQIQNGLTNLSWNEIVAIKIDVEGLEFSVLKGAENTLLNYKPLIMLEGGNRWEGLPEYMEELGYSFAEREGDYLVLLNKLGSKINGFFVHQDKFSYYRSINILK